MTDETYHQRIKEEKRAAAVHAAMELFLEQGYEGTSLQQVAKRADVSTATLFKRFPTKAALFAAIVEEFWEVEPRCASLPATGNPSAGLRKIGLDYTWRMRRPEMLAIYRLIIGEAMRFPDLGQMLYDKGKGPYLAYLNEYLSAETSAGSLCIADIPKASRQFLAIIAGQVFWPELVVPGCGGTKSEAAEIVDEAVSMMMTRYSAKLALTG
jgi:TetR/AcrR family transcriptional regulator of autoinduction and epiphytic fitness